MKLYLALFACLILNTAIAQNDATSINGVLNDNSSDSQYAAQLRIARMKQKLLTQQQAKAGVLPASLAAAEKLNLEGFIHAFDIELADKLGAFNRFEVVDENKLSGAVQSVPDEAPSAPNIHRRKLAVLDTCTSLALAGKFALPVHASLGGSLDNTNTVSKLKSAGIQYVLITTLEDFDENHLDGATFSRSYEYINGQQTGWWVQGVTDENHMHLLASSKQSTSSWQVQSITVNPMVKKEQSMRVTIRSRIIDSSNGAILGSNIKTYARGRSYAAASRGNNELSMSELYHGAAEDLANLERTFVEDTIFPIKILKIENDEVLLNRGGDSGVQLNTHYIVWQKGDAIKDPDSGEILGVEDQNVGEVLIREIQPQFSKAVIDINKGIKPGAVLRLKP